MSLLAGLKVSRTKRCISLLDVVFENFGMEENGLKARVEAS